MPKNVYLSVVIPCFNEEKNIVHGVLETIEKFLANQDYSYEIIIVDDGSTDKSRELITDFTRNKPQFVLMSNSHQGKAQTVVSGMLRAKGEYVLFTDFDQATPLSEIDKLLPSFKNSDVVIGSRKNRRRGAPLTRIIMARGFMMLRNLILKLGIYDTQCGFKAFKSEAAHIIFKKLRLYKSKRKLTGSSVTAGFDVELLYVAKKMGYRIKEVPVEWKYVETRRVNPIWDSLEGLKDLVRIKLNDLRGAYE